MDNKKYQIVLKKPLKPDITLIEVYAPLIAKKAKAGQFIIFRVDAEGERVPLTIAYTDKEKGTVAIIFQKVGASTLALDALNEGECLHDFVGPLGVPTHIEAMGKKVAVVGGGAGCAIAYPIAKALHEHGVEVHTIAGFRNKDLIILEDEMSKACTELHMCTDIGDYGFHGFGTDMLKKLIEEGHQFDHVVAIGPLMMMKFVCKLTKEHNIPTTISMNPIMVDGTGMCGCCRVTVGGETKFACVDGPDFDGHLVDFDEVIARNNSYKAFEAKKKEEHICRMRGKTNA
ncbi:MAG: sulfide/dihydroorotate dehydrogenase-like FAD/NAD-binding protein [Clostridia bacterium]|nr:sulfide/dihydroorotate dehydrogenase-like FAD/NAD-binding protein [Clostridia bacterium]MBR5284216.1 sulfide/dihydroorotate dehydrogenase-like FAD/NAD-binding protein [Clostridia bacterium]